MDVTIVHNDGQWRKSWMLVNGDQALQGCCSHGPSGTLPGTVAALRQHRSKGNHLGCDMDAWSGISDQQQFPSISSANPWMLLNISFLDTDDGGNEAG